MGEIVGDGGQIGENAGIPVSEVIRTGEDGRIFYPESYSHYGEVYDSPPRTVRQWVSEGKKKDPQDLPPLHDPRQMPIWWKRNKVHEVPLKIMRAARSAANEANGGVERLELQDCATGEESEPAVSTFESLDMDGVEAGDAAASYERAAKLEAMAYERLQTEMAKDSPDRTEIDYWNGVYAKHQLARRQWEKDINAIRKDRGELLDKKALVGELVSLAGGIARNFDRSLRILIEELAPDDWSPEKRRHVATEHRDRCFAELRESEFAEAMQSAA